MYMRKMQEFYKTLRIDEYKFRLSVIINFGYISDGDIYTHGINIKSLSDLIEYNKYETATDKNLSSKINLIQEELYHFINYKDIKMDNEQLLLELGFTYKNNYI